MSSTLIGYIIISEMAKAQPHFKSLYFLEYNDKITEFFQITAQEVVE